MNLARSAIKTYIQTGDHIHPDLNLPELSVPAGCFVTLHINGKLRGCVGTFAGSGPLGENVVRMAIAAAAQDTRFPPVTKEELEQIRISISILGVLEKVSSLEEIEKGRHGIYVRLGNRSGTFLPEVAVEQRWSVAEFVAFCAREKAGLSPGKCSQAEIFRYEVEKISEDKNKKE